MTAIEAPNGVNLANNPDDNTEFISNATVYIGFIDIRGAEIVLPDTGDSLIVYIIQEEAGEESTAGSEEGTAGS